MPSNHFLAFIGLSYIPPAETVTDDYPSPEYKWWVKELGLQETEKSIIDKGEKLSDVHMQAVETIFSKQFPDIPKMLPTISFQKLHQVHRASGGHIQIHFTQDHWVVSHLHQNTVNIYDSLNPSTVSADLCEQLQALYLKGTAFISVNIIHVQKQPNLVDCGLYAIANATALAFGEAPEENSYDEGEMQSHLSSCFEANMLVPFPTKSRCRRKTKPIVVCV